MGIAGSKQGTLAESVSSTIEDNFRAESDTQDVQHSLIMSTTLKRTRSPSPEPAPPKRIRLEVPCSRSPSPVSLDYSCSDTIVIEQLSHDHGPQSGNSTWPTEHPKSPVETIPAEDNSVILASTDLAVTLATIHAAADDDVPPEGLQAAPEAPPLSRSQLEMNRMLIQKAILSLRGTWSREFVAFTTLTKQFMPTHLEAPHHRLRDRPMPWQIPKKHRTQPNQCCVPSRKRVREDDGLVDHNDRKRLRWTLKDELMNEADLELPLPVTRGRQRALTGVWPRDGLGGLQRKGELVRGC